MALEVYNPQHPSASSGWVALTASNPWPVASILHIRDTAFAITGVSGSGAGRTATITLPGSPHFAIYGISAHDATSITAGTLAVAWIPKEQSFAAANSQPTPAGATAAGIDASVVIGTADANSYGIVTVMPESFQIRATSFAYTGGPLTTATLNIEVQLH